MSSLFRGHVLCRDLCDHSSDKGSAMKTQLNQILGVVLACLFAFAMSSSYAADTSSRKYSAKVKVQVTASDNIKGSVSSYINRELRSLSDVELVEENPEWIINILAMELKTVGGYKSGVAISTVIVSTFNNQFLADWLQPKFKSAGLQMTSDLAWHPDQWLNVGSSDNLQKLCTDIVADFDTKYLEESRKSFRRMKETLEKSK